MNPAPPVTSSFIWALSVGARVPVKPYRAERRRERIRSNSTRAPPIPSLHRQTERSCDQDPLHLGGALTDLEDLRVAVEPGDLVLLHESVAPEDLGGDPRSRHRRLGRVELGDRSRPLELGD